MHKTNCMQNIEHNSTWEVLSSICPYEGFLSEPRVATSISRIMTSPFGLDLCCFTATYVFRHT